MAQIFLSHHSGDAAAVDALCKHLERNGYGTDDVVFMDRKVPDSVGVLSQNIAARIRESSLVIFCVSDAAIARPWFQEERALAYATNAERGVVFVKVGALAPSADFRGQFLAGASAYPIDLTTPATHAAELEKLITVIPDRLKLPPPVIVQGAIFAFDKSQFEAFQQLAPGLTGGARDSWSALQAICRAFGMTDGERTIDQQLADRYGPTSDDFSPFVNDALAGQSLKDLVEQTLVLVNRARAKSSRLGRIYLRWLHPQLTSSIASERVAAKTAWSKGPSLAFVDALFTLDQTLGSRISPLFAYPDQGRRSVVWVPPHTRRLAELSRFRATTASSNDELSLWFEDLGKKLERSFAFDIADPTELQQWVHRLMSAVNDEHAQPEQDNIARMASSSAKPDTGGGPFFAARRAP